MPTTKRVPRKTRTKMALTAVAVAFQNWTEARFQAQAAERRQTELRDVLKGEVETQGYLDDKGSLYLDLPEPVPGRKLDSKGNEVTFVVETLKNERRVTQVLNEDKAEALLTEKELLDEGTRLVLRVTDQSKAIEALTKAGLLGEEEDATFAVERMLDEEAILALRFEDKLTQDDIDSIFDAKVTFAFKPLEA